MTTHNLATFALGCFWGAEESFRTQPGVTATAVGHMAGAEVAQVTYDPAQTSYETLLMIFWDNHNPTATTSGLERSELFFHDAEQQAAAVASKNNLEISGRYRKQIVTPFSPASDFKRAPEDQQQYYLKHGIASCKM